MGSVARDLPYKLCAVPGGSIKTNRVRDQEPQRDPSRQASSSTALAAAIRPAPAGAWSTSKDFKVAKPTANAKQMPACVLQVQDSHQHHRLQ